jgi:hypothetical protein
MALQFSYTTFIIIYKFHQSHDIHPRKKHFIIEYPSLIKPYKFLGSLAAIMKVLVKAWLLTSFEKETHFIVGRDFGFSRRHANAILARQENILCNQMIGRWQTLV